MKELINKRIEIAANIAIMVVAVIGGIVFAKNLWLHKTVDQHELKMMMPVDYIDWSRSKKNLVLVLSTHCRFCSESAPFYRSLVDATKDNRGVRLIAVFPQDVTEGKQYLKSMDIAIDEVLRKDLSKMAVQATPTLLLINEEGWIQNRWVGQLSQERETEVLKALNGG
jgi:thiol-disulfide isomerase/thioredoxin